MGLTAKNRVYFVEGETEKALVKALQKDKKLKFGKVEKFNLWQNPFKRLARKFNKQSYFIFIIDTDVISNMKMLEENIRFLEAYGCCIWVQNKNLEGELVHCCNKQNFTGLALDLYKVNSSSEFKTKFAQDKSLLVHLKAQDFDEAKLWQRHSGFVQLCIGHQIPSDVIDRFNH